MASNSPGMGQKREHGRCWVKVRIRNPEVQTGAMLSPRPSSFLETLTHLEGHGLPALTWPSSSLSAS